MIARYIISIHPPLAGRDVGKKSASRNKLDFNPPAPCGAGPSESSRIDTPSDFNPPAPCGAGQRSAVHPLADVHFIHRPLRGGTKSYWEERNAKAIFHPPAPCGRDAFTQKVIPVRISLSTAPCGAGPRIYPPTTKTGNFIHRPLRGGTYLREEDAGRDAFQSTRPCGRDWRASRSPRRSRAFHPPAPAGGTFWNTRVRDTILFHPPAPCGRDRDVPAQWRIFVISSTRPFAGGTGGTDVDITAGK